MEPTEKKSLWTTKEWEAMRDKLNQLSLGELESLATRTGIVFQGGIQTLQQKKHVSIEEQIISVLDEIPPSELIREYEHVLSLRK